MRITNAEQMAIRQVLRYGEVYGYGNLITHLRTAWVRKLIAEGVSFVAAKSAVDGGEIYPLTMQDDLVNHGEWDETGRRYADRKPRGKTKRARL